jgi:antitoxin ParD1/3/4
MTQMIRKTISIPKGMANFINSRLDSGLYGNDSEYFRELVRADQRRMETDKGKAAFQDMIEKSIASGKTDLTLDQIFEEARNRARRLKLDGGIASHKLTKNS